MPNAKKTPKAPRAKKGGRGSNTVSIQPVGNYRKNVKKK